MLYLGYIFVIFAGAGAGADVADVADVDVAGAAGGVAANDNCCKAGAKLQRSWCKAGGNKSNYL